MMMEVAETVQIGRPRKSWWDCVEENLKGFGLTQRDAQDGTNGE